MPISAGIAERLRTLSNEKGVFAALAMDQRKSLRRMIAKAAGLADEAIPNEALSAFKTAVSRVLTLHASAVLIDPEYGMDAVSAKAAECGLLLTYESDGFENPRPNKMLELMPLFSVRRLRDLGAAGVKILLTWSPFDDADANDRKRVLIERIGHECAALGM